jgi:AcrR family transcriptional regulator
MSRQRQKEARPGQLVQAAFELFLAHGYSATRMEQIAERAGMSKGAVYLYFPSKEALLTALVEQMLLPRLTPLRALLAQRERPAWERLAEVFETMWSVALNGDGSPMSGLPKLMIAECGNFPELARRFVEGWIVPMQDQVLLGLVEQGRRNGEFGVADPEYQVRVIVGGFVFQLVWLHSLARYDDREMDLRRCFDAWLVQPRAGLMDGRGNG